MARRAVFSRGTASNRAPVRPATSRRTVAAADTENLPANLKKIVGAFQMVPDAMQRYKQLLFFAAKLKGFDEADRVDENKVPGCVSQVWVVPRIEDGLVYFTADSDSQLTKGLAALLVRGLSGAEPREVLTLSPGFIDELGLRQSLTPSRNNGFLNMFLKMQRIALELVMAQEAGR